MAIFHLHAKHVSRGKGQTLAAKSAYNSGSRVYCPRTDRFHNKSSRTGVSYVEILLPKYASNDLRDRQRLVQALEGAEKRHDARVAIDIEMSLPIDLKPRANLDLIRQFAQQMFVDQGLIVDICVHNLSGQNPHCHLLIATRKLQADGTFMPVKDRSREHKGWLVKLRQQWAIAVNQALKKAGIPQEISHESYAKQRKQKIATCHVGPAPKDESQNKVTKRKKRYNQLVTYFNTQRERKQNLPTCNRNRVDSLRRPNPAVVKHLPKLDIRCVQIERRETPNRHQSDEFDLINAADAIVSSLLGSSGKHDDDLLQAADKAVKEVMEEISNKPTSTNRPV